MTNITGTAQPPVPEQTSVTRYVALADTAGGFELPDPLSTPPGSSDREFCQIALPGVTAVPAVIYFRTRRYGTPGFSVSINEASLIQYTFVDADPPEQSWHHIIPATLRDGPTLWAQDNQLIFDIQIGENPSASLVIGDVVIFYTSNELNIEAPITFEP